MTSIVSCERHNWQETGEVSVSLFGFNYRDRRPFAWCKCIVCGQVGFRRPPQKVTYTWQRNAKS